MSAPELWDALDRQGAPLGFDLVRGEPVRSGVFHRVVMVLTATDRGRVLVTRRHPDKPFGLKWEITGGSALKGEAPLDAAVRELAEETGIRLAPEALRPILCLILDGDPALYTIYLARVREAGLSVTLQPGETVDWKLVPYGEFKEMARQGAFSPPFCRGFLEQEAAFDAAVLG